MKTIKSKQDFEKVFNTGKRYNHPLLRMVISDVTKGDPSRVAFVAAKRLGCAVVRNRSKRVMRACAHNLCLPIEGKDIILFATPKTKDASQEELVSALTQLLNRAGVHV